MLNKISNKIEQYIAFMIVKRLVFINNMQFMNSSFESLVKNLQKIHLIIFLNNFQKKTDVLLLTDVSEQFKKICLQNYKIDTCHYFSSPGLYWNAMLIMTNVKLVLMTDVAIYQLTEKVSYVE